MVFDAPDEYAAEHIVITFKSQIDTTSVEEPSSGSNFSRICDYVGMSGCEQIELNLHEFISVFTLCYNEMIHQHFGNFAEEITVAAN